MTAGTTPDEGRALMNTSSSPLVDLHRHLDGSIRESTLVELAHKNGIFLPKKLLFFRGMGLDDALARFEVTLSVLQEPLAVERVAREICEDAAGEDVSILEIRFAPQLHRQAGIEEIVDSALSGIDGRAGLILCGLYGESPEVLNKLVEVGRTRAGVVGIDLAGGPARAHTFGMRDYQAAFARARSVGLGRTVHAGEGRPPEEIAFAVEYLHAQRIGHGTTLLEDRAVVDLVVDRGVVMEACPTSNVHTGVIDRLEDHPVREWLKEGVRACICTDNTFFSDVDLPSELDRVSRALGLTGAEKTILLSHGRAGAFSDLVMVAV